MQTTGGTGIRILEVQLLELKKGCGLGALGLWCEPQQPMRGQHQPPGTAGTINLQLEAGKVCD